MRRTFRYVDVLKPKFLHVMAGDASGEDAKKVFIENLKWACEIAPKGLTLTIEPLNQLAMPEYFLNSYDLAAEVIAKVDAPNLGLQYDSYHAQVITGDAIETFKKFRDIISHVQIGDAPHRTEPGTGEIDFKELFATLKSSGFTGWISGEYTTGPKTDDTLKWMSML